VEPPASKRKYLDAIKTKAEFAPSDWESLLDWTAD